MKRIIEWFLKNRFVISAFLSIVIIALLIIIFGVHIDVNSVNILLAFAAVVSTFFLFMTFWETRKANDIKIYEPVFDDLNKKVIEKLKYLQKIMMNI